MCTGGAAQANDPNGSGKEGRIQYTRTEGAKDTPDVVTIVCYFEQRGLPLAAWKMSVDRLELLVQEPVMLDDILVIGRDFNCNLGRHQGGVTGRRCVHKEPCDRAPCWHGYCHLHA